MAEPEPAPEDRTLGGHYRLLRKLGEGAFGEVYAARHELLGQDFAVKVLKPELCSQQEVRDRFLDEARALIRFSHPNVVQLRHVGEQDGRLYLVMDFVRGEPLSELLAREGPLAEARALALAQQVLQGLSAAHGVGIVHRDLKPGNLMVERRADGSERVHILDFGLSKLSAAGEGLESAHRSLSGTIVGTLAYMSPEQLQGQAVDPRSDVFAAGLVLMEMLQGRHPYAGESGIMVAARLLRDPLPPLAPEVAARTSAPTREALARALERDREARWASAVHFAEALKAKGPPSDTSRIATVAEASAALASLPTASRPPAPAPATPAAPAAAAAAPARSRRGLLLAAGVLVLAGAGAAAVLLRDGAARGTGTREAGTTGAPPAPAPGTATIVPAPAAPAEVPPSAEARMQPVTPAPEVVPAAPPPPQVQPPQLPPAPAPAAADPAPQPASPQPVAPQPVAPPATPQPSTAPPAVPTPSEPAPPVPPTPQALVAQAERELAAGSLAAAASAARAALAADTTSLRALEVLGRALVGEATRLGRSGRTAEAATLLEASASDLAQREQAYQRLQGAEPSLQRQLQGVAAMLRAELHGEAMRWLTVAGRAREAASAREQAVNAFVFAWQSLENDGLRGLELRLRRAAFRMHVGEAKGALEDLAATTKANNESVPVAMWVAHVRGARLLAEQARQQGRLPVARQYLDEARTVLKNASAWREKDFTQADLLEGLRVQVLAAAFEERARDLLAVQGAAGFLERRMATAQAPAGEAPEEAQARAALARGALAYVRARLKQAQGPNTLPAARALAQADLDAADTAVDEALRLRGALEARGGPKVPAFAWHLKAEVARARGDAKAESAARATAWQAHAANDE